MKSKLLLAVAAVTVCAMLVIGGTLAYFTADATKTNTFTVGKIGASLSETNWDSSGSAAARTIAPSRVIAKDPEITITADSEACYARMVVTMPTALYNGSNLKPNNAANTFVTFTAPNPTLWGDAIVSTTSNATTTKIYYKYNNGAVIPNSTNNTNLGDLYTSITIAGTATNDQMLTLANLGANFSIVVNAYVVQSEGFTGATPEASAFAATFASAF